VRVPAGRVEMSERGWANERHTERGEGGGEGQATHASRVGPKAPSRVSTLCQTDRAPGAVAGATRVHRV
jgi:hypothetical protein